nr:MAG TPA: hypothetical protein [Caudoviricetes sp.]
MTSTPSAGWSLNVLLLREASLLIVLVISD